MKIENKRTKGVLNNIGLSVIGRFLTTLSTFLVVPITIDYINPTQYGIWLTLSSIIAWVTILDMGLGQGFRNRFTESMAVGNVILARQYVSTTYITIGCIVTVVFIAIVIFSITVNWSSLLNVDDSYQQELSNVFFVVGLFFCIKMVVGIFCTMLTADQRPGYVSIIQAIGNLLSLFGIFMLTKTSEGSLVNLALCYSAIPCLIILFISFFSFLFSKKYHKLSPTLSCFRIGLIKNILSLGLIHDKN